MAEVSLSQAIQILESGQWLKLRFITADVNQGTGGKVLEFPKCKINWPHKNTAGKKSDKIITSPAGSAITKNPNHSLHFTRNVELENKQLRKVHPILITHINDLAVI